MGRFSRDATGGNIQDDSSGLSGDEIGTGAGGGDDHSQSRSISTGRSIMAAFGRRTVNDGGQESVFSESVSTSITISSGSVLYPLYR